MFYALQLAACMERASLCVARLKARQNRRQYASLCVAGLEVRQNRRLYASLCVVLSPSDIPTRANMKTTNGIYSLLNSLIQNIRHYWKEDPFNVIKLLGNREILNADSFSQLQYRGPQDHSRRNELTLLNNVASYAINITAFQQN